MKIDRSKEWWLTKVDQEGDQPVGAGVPPGAVVTSLDEYVEETPKAQCSKCKRKSWTAQIARCGMRQPDGSYCDGFMESIA